MINGIDEDVNNINRPEEFASMITLFQKKIGTKPTGKIDGTTRKAISKMIRDRYIKIANSLEMIRKINTSAAQTMAHNM
jgi:hypothetical protein